MTRRQFIVTIEGSWLDGDKRVTTAQVGADLRQAVKGQFRFLAKRSSVRRVSTAQPDAQAEVERLTALLNTPETLDFIKGLQLETAHQRERWASSHDAGKAPADWFWLIGFLAQKAMMSHLEGSVDKALHHTITTAAALANWHATILGKNDMRPGIAPPTTPNKENP